MVEAPLLDRLHALAQRKRWLLGLHVGPGCRRLQVALVGAEGAGLTSRVEAFASDWLALGAEIAALFRQLTKPGRHSSTDAALLAALLAESQAVLLEQFAAQIAGVWDRVLAVTVTDSGMWQETAGLRVHLGLCDTARLAELSGLNVIDGFPGRDLAQDGRGGPLTPVPHWMLLHDPQKTRLLVEMECDAELTLLPASRDASGVFRLAYSRVENCSRTDADQLSAAIFARLPTGFGQAASIDEVILRTKRRHRSGLRGIRGALPKARILSIKKLGIPAHALPAAAAAVLGLLHIDQVPGNCTAITGAKAPRILGRLTPGSLAHWHHLVREMATARPSVVTLRSAI